LISSDTSSLSQRQRQRFYHLNSSKSDSKKANNFVDKVTDNDAINAMERLEEIDAKLGYNVGATKERARLHAIIDQWEEDSILKDVAEGELDDGGEDDDDDNIEWDDTKFVPKHSPEERVAIFGGDPARRRQSVEKKLAPHQLLDQFGTPRDVGPSDTSNLLRKISSGQYDVVYVWTRFNCHSSRAAIRHACTQTGTRFCEVESLSYIR
jgi:hypothetical protein